MTDPVDERHIASVNAWVERVQGLPRSRLLDAFEQAFDALWARAHRSLGDVTLTAIVDRVLSTTSDAFPALGALRVAPRRALFRDFRARAAAFSSAVLLDAIRFVLLEFLTILGNLTADILTPALQLELSKVAVPKRLARSLEGNGTPDASPLRGAVAERPPARRPKKRKRPERTRKP